MEEFFVKMRRNSAVILLLLTGAVFLFLKFLVPLTSPILFAMLFLTIFGPLLKRLQKFNVPRQVGAVFLLLLALAFFVGIALLLIRWGWKGFPDLVAQAEGWKAKLPELAGGWLEFGIEELKKSALDLERGMLGGAIRYAGKAASFGGWLVTFLISVLLLAKDYDELMNCLLEREDCHLLLNVTCGVIRYVATFVKAQFVIMSVIALTCMLVLCVAGIPQGLFLGALAGVLDALPFIGTGVVLVPLALIQILEGKMVIAVSCLILYVICIFLREALEPRLIGKRIGVRPILILISLYVGIRLFGVAGIIKGPLGFMILIITWRQVMKNVKK